MAGIGQGAQEWPVLLEQCRGRPQSRGDVIVEPDEPRRDPMRMTLEYLGEDRHRHREFIYGLAAARVIDQIDVERQAHGPRDHRSALQPWKSGYR